ncbi:hypothetical protein [Actinomadura fibrosa]|uniref:DUF4303 domain-containing protein n=1 Tax=Actinomadura fibrosa TaxID=111802 RepID=A0ABW2XD32_9ACTN|nr:hypothetical protein [Actinomadura fibrosa]
MTLQQHMRQAGERALTSFPEKLRPDIYVVSLRISHGEYSTVHELWDYPYDPYMAIGYNTEAEVKRNLDAASDPDPGEIRWSYAYFLLDESGPIGHHPDDPTGTSLYLDEVKSRDLWDENDPTDEQLERLYAHFDEACVDVARHLHASGLVEEVMGRPVPIVLFDMFRPELEVELTRAANPSHLISDYTAFQEQP